MTKKRTKKANSKTVPVQVELDRVLASELKQYAAATRRTMRSVIELALHEYMHPKPMTLPVSALTDSIVRGTRDVVQIRGNSLDAV